MLNSRSPRPTMRDVAAAAGVSLKTVSRVVNQEAGVAADTLERVQAAIAELGFSRNELARSLRPGQRSTMVGLIIGDVTNPFYSRLTRSVEEVARSRRHMVVLASSAEDPDTERELVLELCERRVQGLLVVPSGSDHSYLSAEMERGVAVVFVDRPADHFRADTVVLENREGARQAVAHLVAHGHRRIAHVGDRPDLYTANERQRGYEGALGDAGIAIDPALVRRDIRDAKGARLAVTALLEMANPPTALFTGNNLITLGALQALQHANPRPALVGFDDFEYSSMLPVPVSVVSAEPGDLGARAADLLFRRIDGEDGPPQLVTIPTQLVARGSGEILPPQRT